MNRLTSIVLVIVAVAAGLLYLSTYTVAEWQTAIKFRLGEIVATDMEPGLHFKFPVINRVETFDARVQTLDEEPQRFLTVEQKNVIVDTFVKWRIGDVREYYVTVGGDPDRANLRLSEIIRNGLRNEFGERTVQQVVSGDRSEIADTLREQTRKAANALGMDVVDLRIRRIDLPEDVSESVFQRMVTERQQVAREFRAEGEEEAERIRADADRQRAVLLAEARRDAQRIRGEGDAEAAAIYAEAYSAAPEFYRFYRSLEAYRNSFEGDENLLVLSPDSPFFRYFDSLELVEDEPAGE